MTLKSNLSTIVGPYELVIKSGLFLRSTSMPWACA
jgi:hypothetical protein